MNVYGGISWLALCLIAGMLLAFRKKIDSKFRGRSKVASNEQLKLTATALNNISVASIVGALLLPVFQGHSELGSEWTKGAALTIWALMFGLALHFVALHMLGGMKDE